MNRSSFRAGVLLAPFALLAPSPSGADDLAGAESYLCAAREVFVCPAGDACRRVEPAELNVPDFIEIDLGARLLRTTPASGENRVTAIREVARLDGRVVLQGIENDRAWSFLIDEASGALTASVARDGLSVAAFGVCTPVPVR